MQEDNRLSAHHPQFPCHNGHLLLPPTEQVQSGLLCFIEQRRHEVFETDAVVRKVAEGEVEKDVEKRLQLIRYLDNLLCVVRREHRFELPRSLEAKLSKWCE